MGSTEGISKAAIHGGVASGDLSVRVITARGQVRIVTAVSIHPQPIDIPASEARVSLKPFSRHPGMVNGAWWPRSRDLTAELPALIAVLDQAWGQMNRVTVNVRMWPQVPKRVRTGAHTVRVGWFDAEQDPNDVCLISYGSAPGRWDLLVVPPETDPARAAQLMAAASDVANKQTASALLDDDDDALRRHPQQTTADAPATGSA